ncbi:MAG: hypothetical protein WAV02_17605 [Stellaceae bacterium]
MTLKVQVESDDCALYRVVLARGLPLSPAENLDTAIIAARQAQALGHIVERIERGDETILEGRELSDVIANS